MKAPTCRMCEETVLELNGQYTVLDSYYLGRESSLADTWGDWHLSCLHTSPHREGWYEARLRNHLDVRGYERLVDIGKWTVVRSRRTAEAIAFSKDGDILDLNISGDRLRRVGGGSIYSDLFEQFHFELEDAEVIRAIQEGLTAAKTFPVLAVYELLGICSRMVHPEALEGSLFHWKRGLANQWSRNTVSMRCEYGFFVPSELEKYVTRRKSNRR
jgi:hypothetical protein